MFGGRWQPRVNPAAQPSSCRGLSKRWSGKEDGREDAANVAYDHRHSGDKDLQCDIEYNILMGMVALSSELVDALGDIAADVREGFEADVWAVSGALDLHPAFTDTNVPRSALVRAIIAREFRTAANRRGLNPRSGLGGSVELYEQNGREYAIIRLRGAEVVGEELRVIANNGSTWGGLSDDGLWREAPYVFGCTVTNESVNFFVAEVVGQSDSTVAHLEFGWVHRFGSPQPRAQASFNPDDDESLNGWDEPNAGDIEEQA